MADFEFFKKEFEFKGKHAKMAQELWVRDDTERTYFCLLYTSRCV